MEGRSMEKRGRSVEEMMADDLFARAASGELAGRWFPIETAPNAGVDVLLWWDGAGHIGPARYDDGTIVWSYSEKSDTARPVSPSHWMPLFAPPAEVA